MNELAIDVVTPVLNGADLLERCVLSLQNSRYPNLTHTLVVDARCSDGSIELGQGLAKKYPNVKFILDRGQSAMDAINHGWEITSGEIVTWLGHDNTWTEDAPWEINDCFASQPEADFLAGAVIIAREDGFVERTRLPLPKLDLVDLFFSQYIPAQEGCLWRRRINRKLSASLRISFDYDLWLKMFSDEIVYVSTNKALAVFQARTGQLSSSQVAYAREMNLARMDLAAKRAGGRPEDHAERWAQLHFLLQDRHCAKLLQENRVAVSPRIDLMPWAIGEFFFFVHAPGLLEIVSSQVEARLITICDQNGPVCAVKVKGREGRFRFRAEKTGFYFVDLTARGKDPAANCKLRCDELRWNDETILRREPHHPVTADCPIYSF